MRSAPQAVFVFSGSADGRTLLMDRVSMEKAAFVDLIDSGLESYEFTARSYDARQTRCAVYINGKRYGF